MRRNNFSYLVKQGIIGVWRNKLMSFASLCILMVSLLLVGLSVLVMMDAEIVLGNVEDKNEVAIFLNDDADINHIRDLLSTNPLVDKEKIVYVSKEEGLEEYKKDQDEYSDLFENLPYNPVPAAFKVGITDLTKLTTAVSQFETIKGVYKVNAPHDFASVVLDIRTTMSVIGVAILIALVSVCLVIVSNTTRASVFARRKEINIMRYVGATNSFIKMPFFVEGMFIGVIAGVCSWWLTQLAYNALFQLFEKDFSLWLVFGLSDIISFGDISWIVFLANCVGGATLGAIGTVLSMGKHLKV